MVLYRDRHGRFLRDPPPPPPQPDVVRNTKHEDGCDCVNCDALHRGRMP